MVSIIIPLYNKEKYIKRTLATVFAQTFTDYEIVIVDDGSTDGSVDVIKSINDPRIRLIQQSNAGVSAARNRGINEAKYNLIALLDADDEWKPEYLQTQMDLVNKYPQCDVFCCNYEFKNAEGKVTPTIIRKLPFTGNNGILSNYFEVASCSHPPICSISIMVRKAAIQSVGGFPVEIKFGEDLLTWARLALSENIAYSKKVVSVYCLSSNHSTGNKPKYKKEKDDPVGDSLTSLYKENLKVKGLRRYISHWHKIRTSDFVRGGQKLLAVQSACKSIWYNPLNYKIYIMLVLTCIPNKWYRVFISKFR